MLQNHLLIFYQAVLIRVLLLHLVQKKQVILLKHSVVVLNQERIKLVQERNLQLISEQIWFMHEKLPHIFIQIIPKYSLHLKKDWMQFQTLLKQLNHGIQPVFVLL